MKSVSERLAQEDKILREIRLALKAVRTIATPDRLRKRGTVYASSPITSGRALYFEMKHHGFTGATVAEFRRSFSGIFQKKVLEPNLERGRVFGEHLSNLGWTSVIVPGLFFANGWTQEHYMSLWRQVISYHARTVALGANWSYSLGCTEEFIIALQQGKQLLDQHGNPMKYEYGLQLIRTTMDVIDEIGFDIKPHYELWRLGTLTVEAIRDSE